MNLNADELLARFRRDYPEQFELTRLRALVDAQEREINRLSQLATASPQPAKDPGEPWLYEQTAKGAPYPPGDAGGDRV